MNKIVRLGIVLSVISFTVSSVLNAQDLTGRVGVGGIALAGFPLGQKSVKDQAKDVGPILGGLVQYGINSHWGVGVSYENFDAGHGIRVEPIILQAIHRCMPESRLSPTLSLGIGASRGVDVKNFKHFAAKAGLGLDYFLNSDFAIGPQVNYHYVSESNTSIRHLHGLGAGLAASYYFGKPAAKAVAAAVPAPTAAPAAIELALTPATVTLGPSQNQAFKANVSNAADKTVDWSLAPSLGTLLQDGNYTAPASIPFAEDVTITATSRQDRSKMASSIVHLVPPAAAPQQVSITMNVLFDTNKDVVKPEFRSEVDKVASFMKTYTHTKAEIEGHTDSMGDAAMNQDLSQRRADAVRKVLIDQFGISADRLTSKGYGEDKPIADNKTAEGRASNRRVVGTISAVKN